jgi:ATP-dependent Clp protease protease subunit
MKQKFWRIVNEAESGSAELLLYGEISDVTWWGDEVTPKQFAEDLAAIGGKDLTVRVNSPGGDVFAAQAIYNQLKLYSGRVTMRIDGIAASAATIITCAGDTVIMPANALYMIHNPKSALFGYYDAKEMSKYAETLDTVRDTILAVYSKRVGDNLTDEQLQQKMDAETWMTAKEAQEYGFVDEIDDGVKVTNCLKDGQLIVNSVSCSLSRFQHGDEAERLIKGFDSDADQKPEREGSKRMKENELVEKIKNLLGVGGDAEPVEDNSAAEEAVEPEVDAVQAERDRMMALDALDDHTNEAVTKLIDAAKANGSTAEQVQPFIDIVKADAEDRAEQNKMLDAIKTLIRDEMTSGAEKVAPSVQESKVEDDKQAAIDYVVALANKERNEE